MAEKILAFIARSFDPADEIKVAPIIKFLDSFKSLGFISQSAERSEVESVSEKVRSLIDDSDVLIGIFTRRHPVYRFEDRWKSAFDILLGKLTPSAWSAPPWVLQESGYALKGKKDLILFRETDVEIPGLQGDLEYIPFDPQNPAKAFQRASEMITDLIAKAGGIKVETMVVRAEVPPASIQEAASLVPAHKETDQPKDEAKGTTFGDLIFDLIDMIAEKNWEAAEAKYKEGLEWIKEHRPERQLFWKCIYYRRLFQRGKPEGLTQLRRLVAEDENETDPSEFLADCLADMHEYDEAYKLYIKVAPNAPPAQRASIEMSAAEVLHKNNKSAEAIEIMLRLQREEYARGPDTQYKILKQLYSLYREFDDKFASFAIAELALNQRPEEAAFRFSLAFDYGDESQNKMSLYHYKIICDFEGENAGALNNLGVALSNNEIPILAINRYRQSYKLGETLAASNIARRQLDAGLSDEAMTLLKEAQSKENCVPEVSNTLVSVHNKIKENEEAQAKIIAEAERYREFMLQFAAGFLSKPATKLQGTWALPTGSIQLCQENSNLQGTREERKQENRNLLLFAEGAPRTVTKIERHEFFGTVSGRTCKYKLEIKRSEEPLTPWGALGTPRDGKHEGYIVFSENGDRGRVLEIKEGKPDKFYDISKEA